MRNFIKQNPWFFAGLVMTVLLGLLLVYGLGFWEMVQLISPLPERLRDITFPIWDQYSFSKHGCLVFLSSDDFEKGVAYSHHAVGYLLFMYLFYKIEILIPQLPMRAVVASLEMVFCVLAVVYVALSGQRERVRFHQGALILLAVMFLLTMPGFWISAGKFNVDNPFHLQFPILLVVAHRISQGVASGVKLWLPLGALCVTAPITAALLGMYQVVTSIRNDGLSKNMLKLGVVVILISAVVYLQPVIISKAFGFSSSNSSWLFRSGLDGDVSYFTNILNSVISPYFPRPVYMLALPAGLLLAQLTIMAIRAHDDGKGKAFLVGSGNPILFYGVIFSQYLVTSLLWPQAVSIHPYLYDFMLIAPIFVWIALNLAQSHSLLNNPRVWIWVMLFFISFNLQQIAQAKNSKGCSYPTWNGSQLKL